MKAETLSWTFTKETLGKYLIQVFVKKLALSGESGLLTYRYFFVRFQDFRISKSLIICLQKIGLKTSRYWQVF